jgi:hypothetical protein
MFFFSNKARQGTTPSSGKGPTLTNLYEKMVTPKSSIYLLPALLSPILFAFYDNMSVQFFIVIYSHYAAPQQSFSDLGCLNFGVSHDSLIYIHHRCFLCMSCKIAPVYTVFRRRTHDCLPSPNFPVHSTTLLWEDLLYSVFPYPKRDISATISVGAALF